MPDPIHPTAVIPAGWPLPRSGPPAVPPHPPAPPPWPPYNPPPVPTPRPAVPVTVVIETVRIEVEFAQPEAEQPTWADRLQLWRNLRCCAAAFLPATGWAAALNQCWHQAGIGGAWFLASTALTITALLDQRCRGRTPATPTDRGRGTWLTRTALCAALLGPPLGLPIVGTIAYIVTGVAP